MSSYTAELAEQFHAVLRDFVAWERNRIVLDRTETELAPSAAWTATALGAQFDDERSRRVAIPRDNVRTVEIPERDSKGQRCCAPGAT
jgi:hypothetical protein